MEKIWIFGDSYAANDSNESYTWPKKLSEKYKVTNWAVGGTGPEYMINLFRKELENPKLVLTDLKNINLIFFLSHDSRKDFSFLQQSNDQCFTFHVGMETKFKDKWSISKLKKYAKQKDFLRKFYRDYYLHNNLCDFNHLKYIGILKEFSRFFKKVLVIPVFDNYEEGILYQKFNTTVADIDNFTYSQGPALFFIENEINGNMPNHLCIENHNNMFVQLTNWIENSIPLDTNKFKKIS